MKARLMRCGALAMAVAGLALLLGPGSCYPEEVSRMPDGLPPSDQIKQLPPDGGPEFNRLVFETSPYLLQHARNPVDWHPWGDEAFAIAREQDKPIFLSVGYSTCHWCHVMERESFENEEITRVLNEHFIPIKVDREERPDVDEIYMTATQLITGRGGWPNSVWLTPDGRPWYAGTYFPPEDANGRLGFRSMLQQLAAAWGERRDEVEAQANQLQEAIAGASAVSADRVSGIPTRELVSEAIGELQARFDARRGGFGGAPKFPPHASLRLLLHEYSRGRDEKTLTMLKRTLDAMANGGIHDQIGGGFHRYSTDGDWRVPHFEKMLYDNAMLARAYVEAWALTGDERYRRVAEAAYAWALREMLDEGGAFYSALDADSEGVEGKFYLWTSEQIGQALGSDEGLWLGGIYNVTAAGNYHEEASGRRTGENILYLSDPAGLAEDLTGRVAADGLKLREIRDQRVWPHRDEKVLAAWNGLMIGSLAYAGRTLGEAQYTEAAARAADFVLASMRSEGRLLRTWGRGQAKLNAYLMDYAYLTDALVELHEATGEQRWLDEAQALALIMLEQYEDKVDGGFYLTSEDHEDLMLRVKQPYDQATPSGNGVAAQALVRLAQITGEERYRQAAERTLRAMSGVMAAAPAATESLLLAVAMYHDGQGRGVAATGAPGADASARAEPVTVSAYLSRSAVRPGRTVELAVLIAPDEGWHVNCNAPLQEYMRPTTVGIEASGFNVGAVRYPDGKRVKLGFSADELSVYEGATWIRAELTARDDAQAAETSVRIVVSVQACDNMTCSAPQEVALEVRLQIDPHADEASRRHPTVFGADH